MKWRRVVCNRGYFAELGDLRAFVASLAIAGALVLGSSASALAGNGLTADVRNLFDAVNGAGGDFIIACPKMRNGVPHPEGTLDGECGAGEDEPLFVAYRETEDRRIERGGGGLEENKTVSGHAFGDLMGTSAGDVVCWTFARSSRPRRGESADVKVCARVRAGSGSSSSFFCGIGSRPAELRVRQDAGVCNLAAAELGLQDNSLAYLFAANTAQLAQRGSATITTCSAGFVVQCLDAANLGLTGVTVQSTRPIDAYDGTYVSRRLW